MNKSKRYLIYASLLLLAFVSYIAIWKLVAHKFKYHPPTTRIASAFKPTNPLKEFNLIDSNGNNFTNKSFRGHWNLLFFGYTRCPDICPRTLAIVRQAWQQFSQTSHAAPARFIFADISSTALPYNDLKMFLNNYDEDFLGLTGPNIDMHKLSDQLGIYAKMQAGSEGVMIDHTSALMLIDPQGRLCAVFTPPFSATDLEQDLRILTKL